MASLNLSDRNSPNLAIGTKLYERTNGFVRYMVLYGMLGISVSAIWGGLGLIIYPLHIQQIAFADVFTGADQGVDLQSLIALKAQVADGAAASQEQHRLLGLLSLFESLRAQGLSIVATVGVATTMLAQPLVGAFSDRTKSSAGKRAPWIVGGAAAATLGLCALPLCNSVFQLAAAGALVGIGTNAVAGPLAASIADRVPAGKIGLVSAVHGLGGMVGLTIGALVAGVLFSTLGVSAYLLFSVVLLFALLFAFGAKDEGSLGLILERTGAAAHLKSFTLAVRDTDFRLVWLSKILIMFGYATATTFTLYMLQSYIRPGLSAEEAASTTPLLTLASLPVTLIAMVVAGRWSDKVKRRKPFVILSSFLFALALLVPLLWPTLIGMYVQSILMGFALGSFLVVDQALIIDVLPDPQASGRDLGIANLGTNLGQSVAPLVAGSIVALTGSYQLIWAVAVVAVLVSAVFIFPVKRVR
jgi:MFS family permease